MINLIACVDKNGGLGKDGHCLYRVPEDIAMFKALTANKDVAVGRRTWETLPREYQLMVYPFILTRSDDYDAGKPAEIFSDPEDFTSVLHNTYTLYGTEDLWVIGGAKVYELMLPFADYVYLGTWKGEAKDADTFFPKFKGYDRKAIYKTKNYDFSRYTIVS